jgi:hypothetical protein
MAFRHRPRARVCFALLSSLAAASFASGCAPVAPPADSGTDANIPAMDGSAETSAPDGGRDSSAHTMDGAPQPDASVPADVVINPGRCGARVRECLCNCGANATCQQACPQADPTCSDCLFEAITMCCPMENAAVETCIIESMCEDDACILSRCGTQWNALQTCARRREREPSCLVHVQACLGPDYPAIQCVRDP